MTNNRTWNRQASLVAIALALSVCMARPDCLQAADAPPPIQITSVSTAQSGDATQVQIAATGKPRWVAKFGNDHGLELQLLGAVPAPGLADLHPATGLVTAVTFEPEGDAESPTVRVEISTRTRIGASIASQDNQLTATLHASGRSERGEEAIESTTEATPAPVVPETDEKGAERPEAATTGFHIGPGDVLDVQVFGMEDLNRKVRVAADGSISLPLLGTVRIGDLTVEEAEKKLETLLADRQLVNDPQVTIFVEEFVSHTVTLQGAVKNPGTYPLRGRSTLLDLIAAAGGLQSAYGRNILILHTAKDGGQSKTEIDANRLISEGDTSLNVTLQPGDIVMVPQAREFHVYVTGAVRSPGAVEYSSSEGITVLQAITAAGGPTERANLGNVHINRRLPDGSQRRIKVDLKRIQRGRADDVLLQRNDTVVVGEWFF